MTAIHSNPSSPGGTGSPPLLPALAVTIAVVALLVVGVGWPPSSPGTPEPGGRISDLVANGTPAVDTIQPLTLVAAPRPMRPPASPATRRSVAFSAPVNPASPQPTLTPAVAGTWQLLTPTTYTFVATTPFAPLDGNRHRSRRHRRHRGQDPGTDTSVHFTVADGGMLRLQQLLATLGYLPLSFTPTRSLAAPQEAAQAQEGMFAWKGNERTSLTSLWTQGTVHHHHRRGHVLPEQAEHADRWRRRPGGVGGIAE